MSFKLKFYFQPPFTGWMPTTIFEDLYNHYKLVYDESIISDTTSITYNNNHGHRSGPHHLIIENIDSGYYKVVTYWDRAQELLNDDCEWNNIKCMGIFSCVNAKNNPKIIGSSYCCYNKEIENAINKNNSNFGEKECDSLLFRGYLHGSRFLLNSLNVENSTIKITNNRISYTDYIAELSNHKIGLSLNGAAEICNRDIEILGIGSVLLRPKLNTTDFHNPLIPEFHYVSFEETNDPKAQMDIILEKYNMLLKDQDYMMYIAANGKEWYNINGSRQGNVSILSSIINIEELL